ncbi:HEAT repeat domain-containing protein [Kitasatospora sp. NPDC056184]|uniref:HEAT repeat domain-containing protein n=1 Tax=Kitasatospora sp. NPDC056184 TaxID=3345738 RepID=UPI0035D7072B
MRLPSLLAALERGDDITVFEFLDEAAGDELAGDDGISLLAAAAYAGRHKVVDRLVVWGVDPTHPWAGGVDPVTWAAGNGAYWVLDALLSPDRDPLRADSPHRRALRVAQAALESGTGAGRAPLAAHRGVITDLEARLGVHRTPDELMARALVRADPEHDDWFASLFHIARPESQERFDWARAVAEGAGDAGSLDRRRFALDVIQFLGFGLNPDSGDDEPPFTREAAEFLRPRLDTEQDPYALRTVVAAFTGYCSREELPAVLALADHPDPVVRNCVALALPALPALLADGIDALGVLLSLADDPVPMIRTSALYALTLSSDDTPALRGVLLARLTDAQADVRLEAAIALALRDDERATPVLDEIRRGGKTISSHGARRLDYLHHQLRARTPGM